MSKDSIMALFGPKSSPVPPVNNFASPQFGQQQQQQQQFGSMPQQLGSLQQPQQQLGSLQQQQLGSLQQQQFSSLQQFAAPPQQPLQQQGVFGQFQSPSLFSPQQQPNFLGGANFSMGQVNQAPAFNSAPNMTQHNSKFVSN